MMEKTSQTWHKLHLTKPARGMPKPPLRSGFGIPAGGVRLKIGAYMKGIKILFLLPLIFISGCAVQNIQKQPSSDMSPDDSTGYVIGSFFYSDRESAARLALELINTKTKEEFLFELRRPKAYKGIELYPILPGEYHISNIVRLSGTGGVIRKHELSITEIIRPFVIPKGQATYIGHYDGKTTRDVMTIFLAGPAFSSNDTQATKIYMIQTEELVNELRLKYPEFADIPVQVPFKIAPIVQQNEAHPYK